jgi:DNA repair exonuclease SbcCD nuclease subunit
LTVYGSRVGPSGFTFRRGPDVIPGRSIPPGFAAILSGHIHRAQTLTHDLAGRPFAAPVIYPGSIERTAFAERYEEKCYVKLEIEMGEGVKGLKVDIKYVKLPARPMVVLALDGRSKQFEALSEEMRYRLDELDSDAVVRVDVSGPLVEGVGQRLSAAWLRSLARPTMNISLGRMEDGPD